MYKCQCLEQVQGIDKCTLEGFCFHLNCRNLMSAPLQQVQAPNFVNDLN